MAFEEVKVKDSIVWAVPQSEENLLVEHNICSRDPDGLCLVGDGDGKIRGPGLHSLSLPSDLHPYYCRTRVKTAMTLSRSNHTRRFLSLVFNVKE